MLTLTWACSLCLRLLQGQVEHSTPCTFIVSCRATCFASSSRPAIPCAFKRFSQLGPAVLPAPTRGPVSVAPNVGSSTTIYMICARFASLTDTVCALASRSISAFSYSLTGHSSIGFVMAFSSYRIMNHDMIKVYTLVYLVRKSLNSVCAFSRVNFSASLQRRWK